MYISIAAGPQGIQYWLDQDGDGWGGVISQTFCNTPPLGWVQVTGDCDDNDPAVFPGAVEVCDGLDNNCNGQIDEGCNPPCIGGPFFGTWQINTPCGLCQGRAGVSWVAINQSAVSPIIWQWNPWWGWVTAVNQNLIGWKVQWTDANGNIISNWWQVNGLCAGDYTVTVTDPNGCSNSQVVTIDDDCPTTANCATFTATMYTQAASDPSTCDGEAKVDPQNGSGNYSFNWSNGDTNQWTNGLCIGSISVTVTDLNTGCTAIATGIIGCPTCLIAPPGNGGTTSAATATDDNATDDRATTTVTTTSLEKAGFRLYPNPANDVLNIETPMNVKEILIFDLSGKLVMQFAKPATTTEVDVSGFMPGTYILRLTTDKEVFTSKFVKM